VSPSLYLSEKNLLLLHRNFTITNILLHYSVVANDTNGKINVMAGLKELLRNKNYILLFLCFNFVYGIYSAVGTVISSLTKPYGFSIADNSVFSLVFLVAGIFNSFFLGTILDKYQNYKKLITIISFGTSVSTALFGLALFTESKVFVVFAIAVMGAFIIPIMSVTYSFAVELAYPLPEALVNGMLISCSLIWGALLVLYHI
jgi:predicted MFS family arabinose efflux permease